MPKHFKIDPLNRIIDANINRAKEGLRVCEEITRFMLSSASLTAKFKKIRHEINSLSRRLPVSHLELLESRESRKDVGRHIYANELKREGLSDIFFANLQRGKESLRVLEEFTKLCDKKLAIGFKRIRYSLYQIEKEAAGKIKAR